MPEKILEGFCDAAKAASLKKYRPRAVFFQPTGPASLMQSVGLFFEIFIIA